MKKMFRKNNDGMFTLEAVLVFTAMLFIILAVIYGLMLMYQYVVVLNASATGADAAVTYWEAGMGKSQIISETTRTVQEELGKGILNVRGNGCHIDVSIQGGNYLGDKVIVSVKQDILRPVSQLSQFLGGEAFCIKGYAENKFAGIRSAQSIINNVDWGFELVSRIAKTGENIISDFLPFLIY